MRVDLTEIKTALKWLMENTNDDHVDVEIDARRLLLRSMDKYGKSVKITLYTSGTKMASITYTDRLK